MNQRITVAVPTKDRLLELSLLLQSLLYQTYQEFDVLIINDCHTDVFSNNTLKSLINLLKQSNHDVTILEGKRKGPHIAGQMILENSKHELILRLDDDVSLRPSFIENLVSMFEDDKVGAVGPVYLNPHTDIKTQMIDPNLPRDFLEQQGKVFWDNNGQLFLTGWLQTNIHPTNEPLQVEHLNSGFIYRRSIGLKMGGYCLDFSPVGHREESDFSYRIFKEGYKLFINPNSIAMHFHPMAGGIRETNGQILGKENWDHDEKIFLDRMKKWLPITKKMKEDDLVSVIILTHGKDHNDLRELLKGISTYTNHTNEIIIVNNDTSDDSLDDAMNVRDEFPTLNIQIVGVDKELSVSEARNEGVKFSDPSSKYICFIDDDARILGRYNQVTDFIDYLYNRFHEEPDVGAVGPIYTWFEPLKTYSLSVACLFTSKKVWEIVGGFDPVFGNKEKQTWGYEDVDFSYRCFSKGFKLLGVKGGELPFYHLDTTIKPKSPEREQALLKAYDILMSKYDMNEINRFSNRTIYPFTPNQMDVHGTKLNIGCYFMKLDEFINIDIKPDIGADLICNGKELNKHFNPNSVDMILASHVLEHFDSKEGNETLQLWYNLLKPNGNLIVEVPDCEDAVDKVKEGKITKQDLDTIYHGCPQEFGQTHKALYDRKSLYELLKETGFRLIEENLNTSIGYKNDMAFRYDCIK